MYKCISNTGATSFKMFHQKEPGHHGKKISVDIYMLAGRVDYFKTVSSSYRNSTPHIFLH